MNNDINNNLNGIVEAKYKNGIYKTWTVELIRPFVIKYLKELYPISVIVRELNDIDITIVDEKSNDIIPVEIQKSIIKHENRVKNTTFAHAHFEGAIRKQIEDNITNYEKCWFFMDSEYLRYLQSGNIGKTTSINMTWLIKLMNDGSLKVFSIRYDGIVKELIINDLYFLKNISHTCQIGYDNDERILNRNKLKIYRNVIHGYKFTQEEIDSFYKKFDNRAKDDIKIDSKNFFMKYGDERCKLYGYVFQAVGTLSTINKCLDMNTNNPNDKLFATRLGIFETIGNYSYGSRGYHMKFVDKFDICKYFPGYLRQERHWLTYKGNEMDGRTFSNMCGGMYKNAATLFDY